MSHNTFWQISLATCLFLPSLAFSDTNATIQLNEVTVSGEKIERSLQETTTAVSVFQTDQVDTAGAHSVYDVASHVPNMINNPSDIPVIRGVNGAGAAIGGFSMLSGSRPRISTSVDGISEAWNGQRYLDIGSWDIEQVEVLRGPQSTTQGRNSIGGAVVVTTKDPSFEPEGAVRIGYENQDDKALVAAMISGPVIDDVLALRLSAEGVYGHNFINYQNYANYWDPSDVKQGNVRAKALWLPQDVDGLIVKVSASHRASEGGHMNEIMPNSAISDYAFRLSSSNLVRYNDSTNDTFSTDVEYAINNDLKLYVLAGYNSTETKTKQAPTAMNLDIDEKSETLETRSVHDPKDGLLTSMAGLYFYHRAQDMLVTDQIKMNGDDDITALAFYTEESLHVNDKFDIIFGGRVEREEQERDVTYMSKPMNADVAETMFLPKVGVNYKLTPEHNVGFTVRKGYSPGGGALTWDTYEYYEYDKEEVWTYEATTRSLLLDKTLTLNTNLFYNEYKGYQGIAGSGYGQRFINIPEGESYGFEAETIYRITSDLELQGGFGLLRTKITEADANNYAKKGNEFNHAPHFTGSLGFKQHFMSGFFVGGDLNYVSEYYTNVTNTEAYKAGDYTLVNFNVGYETKAYTIRTYLKNAFDEDVLYNYRGTFRQVGQPRTFGVTFDYRF
ncbi:TonB-dependent receptor [Sulfurospirillum sp. MES]|uniref:TonB-dependent receptor n=1 Tax=Sulfurospirillum sp. MES TaxID=1565314 RepID=UPI000541AB52|nr:TonB-dependent receptor [Sulfurospirillum sp. MES]KHG34396.1 MAG: hypothetical protein OA34_04660 [Sulfurospirillum sp. MES]